MRHVLYLAWRYLRYHRFKTVTLVLSIAMIVYIPVGLRVLVLQSREQLTSRAQATPLLIGAKGSPLELTLNSLYFSSDLPATMNYAEVTRVQKSGLAASIPLYVRFRAQETPIVGTSLDYFAFRSLRIAGGRVMGRLGECVIGAEVAKRRELRVGDTITSSPESLLDLAGVYPLKMHIVGVLAPAGTPDDLAVFVDVKTTWIIQGLAHGHQDLSQPEAETAVLKRDGNRIVANASVRQFNEITEDNRDAFHFHGDTSDFPITAVIAIPPNEKSSARLRGRYFAENQTHQILQPTKILDQLLATVFTVQGFVIAALVLVGVATLAVATLVFLLSIQLRRREVDTMNKIGGTRWRIGSVLAAEILFVVLAGLLLAGGLTAMTRQFADSLIRVFLMA